MNDIADRVCAGLRKIKRQPDALLFLDDIVDWTWDCPTLGLLFVFHTSSVVCSGWGSDEIDCPFVPMWHDDHPDALVDVKRFMSAYCEQVDNNASL